MRTTVALKIAAVVAFGSLVALGTRAAVRGQAQGGAAVNWALHNLDLRNSRYAPFDDINAGNVELAGREMALRRAGGRQRRPRHAARRRRRLVLQRRFEAVRARCRHRQGIVGHAGRTAVSGKRPRPRIRRRTHLCVRADGPVCRRRQDRVASSSRSATKGGCTFAERSARRQVPAQDAAGYSIQAPPAYHNGTLYVGLAMSEAHIPGGLMVALDGRTGAVKWVFNTDPSGTGGRWLGDREGHVARRSARRRRHLDAAGHRSRARPALCQRRQSLTRLRRLGAEG